MVASVSLMSDIIAVGSTASAWDTMSSKPSNFGIV